jgi:hypothetical protein
MKTDKEETVKLVNGLQRRKELWVLRLPAPFLRS